MRQPPWKRLVEQLKSDEFESTYLDRLDRRLTIATGRASLEQEVVEEMSFALKKTSDKVNLVLLELDVLRHELANKDFGPTVRQKKIELFNLKRKEALRARWELMVQREALGFLRHDGIEQDYPIPDALKDDLH